METKSLFLRVNAIRPIGQSRFLDLLADTVRQLSVRFPPALLSDGQDLTIPDSLDQTLPVHDRYFGAIVLGVLSNDSGSTSERTAFLNEADCAYRSLWREAAAHRQIGVAEGGVQ